MRKKLFIEGMRCNHCTGNLQDALTEDISGVEVIEISLDEKYAIIDLNESVNLNNIKEIIEDLGFKLISVE